MKQEWQKFSDKFLQLTPREQYLVILTGFIAIFFIMSYAFIDEKSEKIAKFDKQSQKMEIANRTLKLTIQEYQNGLKHDPDKETIKKIEQLESKLSELDEHLIHLTTDLISPIEMRQALLKLLQLEPGVSLLSFELTGATPLLDIKQIQSGTQQTEARAKPSMLGLNLYKHGIKIKLSGKYFQLRNYLQQLEQLDWTFFWQSFHYQVREYPRSEVEITIYSLGLNKEFVGV